MNAATHCFGCGLTLEGSQDAAGADENVLARLKARQRWSRPPDGR